VTGKVEQFAALGRGYRRIYRPTLKGANMGE